MDMRCGRLHHSLFLQWDSKGFTNSNAQWKLNENIVCVYECLLMGNYIKNFSYTEEIELMSF